MKDHKVTQELIEAYGEHLCREERASGTVENYLRHARAFAAWLGGRPASKEAAAEWKQELVFRGYCPSTVNAMLGGVNGLFAFAGWPECRVKVLRLQRRLFCEESRELTKAEYGRLLAAAHSLGRERLALLMETICATGIRVSEVRYITVEAAGRGRAEVALKGKIRTIFLLGKLRRKLLQYARKNKTAFW